MSDLLPATLVNSSMDTEKCQVGPTGTQITRPRVRALHAGAPGVLAGDGAGAAGVTPTARATAMASGNADRAPGTLAPRFAGDVRPEPSYGWR